MYSVKYIIEFLSYEIQEAVWMLSIHIKNNYVCVSGAIDIMITYNMVNHLLLYQALSCAYVTSLHPTSSWQSYWIISFWI